MAAAKDYRKAGLKIEECQNILARAESLDQHNKDNSVHNLLSSALDVIMRAIDAQASALAVLADLKVNRQAAVGETDAALQTGVTTEITTVNTLKLRAKTIVKEVSYSLQMAQAQISGDDISNRKLIVQMYDYTACANNRCKESELKSVKYLTGRESDLDWSCESMLSQLSNVGSQLELSEKALTQACLSRLQDVASQVIRGRLDSLSLTQDNVPFAILHRLLEEAFMRFSDAKSALRALYSLKPLPPNSTNYQILEAQILRLCRLSLQDITDAREKSLLYQTRSKEVFLRCLSVADRGKISLKEIERASKSEGPMSLHQIVSHLTDISKINAETSNHAPLPYNDSTIRQTTAMDAQDMNQVQDEQMEEYDQVFWIPRGRGRGRVRQRGQGQQQQQHQQQNQVQQAYQRQDYAKQQQRGRPFQQNRGNRAPWRGRQGRYIGRGYNNYQNNNNQNNNYQNNNYQNNNRNNNNQTGYNNNNYNNNNNNRGAEQSFHQKLNLPPGVCVACAQPKPFCYGKNSAGCVYAGTTLFNSACPNFDASTLKNYNKTNPQHQGICTGGCHSKKACHGVLSNALQARRKWVHDSQIQRLADDEQDEEDPFDPSEFLDQLVSGN